MIRGEGNEFIAGVSAQEVFDFVLDPAQYTPFPGSTFEHGASGWSWGGKANIVAGDGNVALAAGSHP